MTECRSYLRVVLLAITVFVADRAAAQGPSFATHRPAFSPYLNLLRRDQNPALNYYGLVRPQVQYNDSIQNLQTRQTALEQEAAVGQNNTTNLPPTGHRAGFLTHKRFFMTSGSAR